MKLITIYKLTCIITNLSYIGQTKNGVLKRIYNHIRADSLIGEALREHELKNFKLEFIWQAINRKEADIVEKAAICAYKTRNPNGYNIAKGGGGGLTLPGWHHTEDAKRKIGKTGKGRKRPDVTKRNKENNSMKNPETAAKSGATKKGKKRSDVAERNKGNKYGQGHTYKPTKISILKQRFVRLRNYLNNNSGE